MNFPGKAINIVLKRELKGTNTLTFDMVDGYFDSLNGEYVENEFINELFPERKIKLYYQDQWFEFFIKKINEKKILKNYIKSYTCTDAFIDELSRNGYGLTFDEDLYNNVDEIGNFSEEVLDGSLWHYNPEYNWGDFSEFTEERLYKIPLSQFGGSISGYRLNFNLSEKQREKLEIKAIKNIYTDEERNIFLSDDAAREIFWDQQNFNNPNGEKENPLTSQYVDDIENDGYIYVPYTCLNFCYGSKSPEEQFKYDRAATEEALSVDNKTVVSPQSVDPKTLIQFIAIPKNKTIEVDEQGVILNKECHYFMTLRQWNEAIKNNYWYFFEDTRLVDAKTLGSENLMDAAISHTFRYLYNARDEKILDTYKESYGNKIAFYDGYLNDADGNTLMGRKYSIADRTEINISKDIDQYVTVYNNSPDDFISDNENLYSNEDWIYEKGDNKYRVCSKIATRQVIPQLARNLIQNGIKIQSTDGWSPMTYLDSDKDNITSGNYELKMMKKEDEINIDSGFLYYCPPHKNLGYMWTEEKDGKITTIYQIKGNFYKKDENDSSVYKLVAESGTQKYKEYRVNYQKQDEIERIFINDEGKICWTLQNEDSQEKVEKEIGFKNLNMVNFGIVGQNKIIEKDKIYCLGIEILIDAEKGEDDFTIQIGKGSLVQSGSYDFVDKVIEISKSQLFENEDLTNNDFDWEKLYENNTIPYCNFKHRYLLFRAPKTIKNPYFIINCKRRYALKTIELFEAYTKGQDAFVKEDAPFYRYSGRDLFGCEQPDDHNKENWRNKPSTDNTYSYFYSYAFKKEDIRKKIIFEDAIMLGSTYEYQQYFIQRLKTLSDGDCYDTCGIKEFISSENLEDEKLPLDAEKYTEDDYVIETNFINLNKCKYYDSEAAINKCDCGYQNNNSPTSICYYQKFGYCPYRFQTEKHPRKIRTLKISKSNRFNIVQEISKVFKAYPQFYINHKKTGHISKKDETYERNVFYITEKGMENKIGFRYEKNLKDISRQFDSEKIVTKMYVQDVDSELSKTGLCSIKSAEDNISKDSFIIDFSYYFKKGLLDKDITEKDLYGNYLNANKEQGFLRLLGYYNDQYDKITNKIINLQDTSFTELEANLKVNLEGITTSQEQLVKIKKQMDSFLVNNVDETSQSYLSYKNKKEEQETILLNLLSNTFYTNGVPETDSKYYKEEYGVREWNDEQQYSNSEEWFDYYIIDYEKMKETWVDQHIYTKGLLGQYNKEYNQISLWKKERASYLKMINKISENFYKKYEPYLKEGTWQDSNYLSDNAYYYGALQTAAQGAIPKVSYNISVIGLDIFDEYKDIYDFYLGDITWIEDVGMFGINQKTGLPNRIKVLVSEISYNLEEPQKDTIKIQNYTTKFEDLFQQITASVQSLQYNENIYKRSSNFTALKNIETDSLQGALSQNNLTFLNTAEENIQLDQEGTRGSDINNHANKYKQNGQGIYFSNDGGQHWNVGIGPGGINADYIKVGTLDASKIRIVDGNYLYFSWDKDGIIAYRDPQGINTTDNNINDIACFNKYGLSIYSDNHIKLRAGYSFNGSNGELNSENDVGNNIGFYLYNNYGQQILAAENGDNSNSSQIRLFGEMMAANRVVDQDNQSYLFNYSDLVKVAKTDEGILLKEDEWNHIIIESLVYESKEYVDDEPQYIFIDGKIGRYDGYYSYNRKCSIYKIKNAVLNNEFYEILYLIQEPRFNLKPGNSCFYSTKEGIDWNLKKIIGFSTQYNPIGNSYAAGDISSSYYNLSDTKGYILANIEAIKDGDTFKKGFLFKGTMTDDFYLKKERAEKDTSGTVFYLNNKTGLLGNEAPSAKRLLFFGKQDGANVQNYLTIFDNGSIFITGTIDNENIYSLSESFTIRDGIELTSSTILNMLKGLIKSGGTANAN